MNYLLAKTRYSKLCDNGVAKEVTEQDLVNATSFTEAEKLLYENLIQFSEGGLSIQSIAKSKYAEVIYGKSLTEREHKFYEVKVNFIEIDERTAKAKKSPRYYLVGADDIEDCKKTFSEYMNGTIADYEIELYKETKIVDVINDVQAQELSKQSE